MTLHPSFTARPISHRALHDKSEGRPENSREAVSAAIEAGYGIEIDLQMSSDGQAMVFHDYTLDRLTGETGPVAKRSAEELGRIPLSGGPTGIPTLPEILAIVDGRVPLVIEVKDQDGALGNDVGTLEAATARALDGYEGDVALMSFNPHSVACFANLSPSRPRGLTTDAFTEEGWPKVPSDERDRLREIADYNRVGASFVSHDHRDLKRPRVAALKELGATILCWTVVNPKQEKRARKVADQITFERYIA